MRLFVLGIISAVAVLIAVGILAVYSGAYNVAADKPHTAVEVWILRLAMTNSVKTHAESIAPPSDFGAEHRIHDGYHLFDEMCVQCHGAPGKKPGEVGLGLRPEPPDLSKAVNRWKTAQLMWIVRHGIAATGMPAFGGTHTDEQLWNIVAFVEKLPSLTAEQYKAFEHGGGQPQHGPEHQHGH